MNQEEKKKTNKPTPSLSTFIKRVNLPPSSRVPSGSARLRKAEQAFTTPRPRVGEAEGHRGESRPTLRTPRPDLACTAAPGPLAPTSAPLGSRGARLPAPDTVARSPLAWQARRDLRTPAPAVLPRSAAGFVPPPVCSGRRVNRSLLLSVAQLPRRGPGREGAWRGTWTPFPRTQEAATPGRRRVYFSVFQNRSFKPFPLPPAPHPGDRYRRAPHALAGLAELPPNVLGPAPSGPASTGPVTPPPRDSVLLAL